MHALRHLSDHTMCLQILQPPEPGWQAAALMIEGHFCDAFDARTTLPAVPLAVARSASGAVLGAAGLRDAAAGFFSQVYLDRPVARLLSERSGRAVCDDDILEVVSMACPRPIATLPLIEAIATNARQRGKTWGLFTATAPLIAMLQRTGVPLMALAPARPECLPDAACWGRYYDTNPWVCALAERSEPLRFMPRPSRTLCKVADR
ncbi:MAG: thermostable hemolysin [Paracoccus hibiscisoli]|uniref:thermostable hemolysin n=1 Tax=Paracoccus hibiscisoli TaxID=2023261 RepID=UPI003918CE27